MTMPSRRSTATGCKPDRAGSRLPLPVSCPNCNAQDFPRLGSDKMVCARCGNVWVWNRIAHLRIVA